MTKIKHNPAIFKSDPETTSELSKRHTKEWLKLIGMVVLTWFLMKCMLVVVTPRDMSLLVFNPLFDPMLVVGGIWLTYKVSRDRRLHYRPKSEAFNHAFRKVAATIEDTDNQNNLRKYVAHPNFKDRYPTYAEVTALMQLRKQEQMDASEKSDIFSD